MEGFQFPKWTLVNLQKNARRKEITNTRDVPAAGPREETGLEVQLVVFFTNSLNRATCRNTECGKGFQAADEPKHRKEDRWQYGTTIVERTAYNEQDAQTAHTSASGRVGLTSGKGRVLTAPHHRHHPHGVGRQNGRVEGEHAHRPAI